jgi:twinkle protein
MPQFQKEVETIKFNYFRNNELINVKYRGAEKSFKLEKDAELILYLYDNIKNCETCIICEGEIDALSYYETGYHNVCSVPNGANDNLQYIENCWEILENKKVIYLATDNDQKGILLRDELIRRFGSDKCRLINFKDCKDANDYLLKYGKEELYKTVNDSQEIPCEGIIYLANVFENMQNTFRNGKRRGTTTYIKSLDNHWTWRDGEVNLWTGYMNEGKSSFLADICILRAKNENAKFAFFSPENYPAEDFYDELIHSYLGKSVDKSYTNVMSEEEYINSAIFINEHFFIVLPDDNFSIDTILMKFKWLIGKYGVNACIIDPYNQIEHHMERGEREDLYISKFMSKLKRFAIDHSISMNLVAHQVTPQFQNGKDYPQPDAYKIKGGGTFADKADNVINVWRPYRKSNPQSTTVKIIVDKVKKQRLVGKPGEITISFDCAKNQYFDSYDEVEKLKQNDLNNWMID